MGKDLADHRQATLQTAGEMVRQAPLDAVTEGGGRRRGHSRNGSFFDEDSDIVQLVEIRGVDSTEKKDRLHTPPSTQNGNPQRRKLEEEGVVNGVGQPAATTTVTVAVVEVEVSAPAASVYSHEEEATLVATEAKPVLSLSAPEHTPEPLALAGTSDKVEEEVKDKEEEKQQTHKRIVSLGSTVSSASSASVEDDVAEVPSSTKRKVRFAEEEDVLGYAYSKEEYNRSAIVVDLSKTPYALFRKDALLLKNPEEASPRNLSPHRLAHSWSDEDIRSASAEFGELQEEKEMKPNFSGVWRRSAEEGYLELLVFSGVKTAAARHAVRKRPLHVIDHDEDYLRLIVKNGLSKVDRHYIIGEESIADSKVNPETEVSVYWGDGTGDGLSNQIVISSINRTSNTETIAVRELLDGGDTLVLRQVVRKLQTGEECKAKHTFTKIKTIEALRSTRTDLSI